MRPILLTCLALMLAAGSPTTDRARELYARGEKQAAFELVAAASPDDLDALDFLARFYDFGRYVPHDPARAASLYRQAAERGHPHAQWRLGDMLATGEGVAEDEAEAVAWLSRAAAQDHAPAHVSLGLAYAEGRGVETDHAAAMRHYRRAAELGDAAGCFFVATLYALGQGVPEDRIEATGWLFAATVLGDPNADEMVEALALSPAEMTQGIARGNAILERLGPRGAAPEAPSREGIRRSGDRGRGA